MNAFEAGDLRRKNWVDSSVVDGNVYYFPFKYKVNYNPTILEDIMVLRISEQYLIRAEARAHKNLELTGAVNDLNIVRQRAGLPALSDNLSQDEILAATMKERRVELFTEWGNRWLDLKRSNMADSVLSAEKGQSWQSTDTLYPIPFNEIQTNVYLKHKNPGY